MLKFVLIVLMTIPYLTTAFAQSDSRVIDREDGTRIFISKISNNFICYMNYPDHQTPSIPELDSPDMGPYYCDENGNGVPGPAASVEFPRGQGDCHSTFSCSGHPIREDIKSKRCSEIGGTYWYSYDRTRCLKL